MSKISVEGASDLHVHSYPSLFNRIGDDRTIVAAAADAGMRAMVLKCHHESTVSRAYLINSEFPTIEVFGGIVLNSFVGGINPAAVESALRLGAKVVWMPTVDAANEAQTFGSTMGYRSKNGDKQTVESITIVGEGVLRAEVHEVLHLVAQYDTVLGTGHLFPNEILELTRAAKEAGVNKLVINHPYFPVPNIEPTLLQELVGMGAIAELDYCGISPMWAWEGNSLARMVETISTLKPHNCILVSDAGQAHNPIPAEALRILAQCLNERGISKVDLRTMMVDKPAELLGLEMRRSDGVD